MYFLFIIFNIKRLFSASFFLFLTSLRRSFLPLSFCFSLAYVSLFCLFLRVSHWLTTLFCVDGRYINNVIHCMIEVRKSVVKWFGENKFGILADFSYLCEQKKIV